MKLVFALKCWNWEAFIFALLNFNWIYYTYNKNLSEAKSLQLCLTVCDPIDGSPPGSPVPGILQARTLEWGAISFSNAWKWKVKVKLLSHVRLLATPWTAAYQAPLGPWDFPGKSTGVGCHCLLQIKTYTHSNQNQVFRQTTAQNHQQFLFREALGHDLDWSHPHEGHHSLGLHGTLQVSWINPIFSSFMPCHIQLLPWD